MAGAAGLASPDAGPTASWWPTDVAMEWFTNYQGMRDRCWPEVEQYLGSLPPRLFRQGALLKNNLAILYSSTGQFKDILCCPQDHPLLYQPFWILDDWRFPQGAERSKRGSPSYRRRTPPF